MLGAISETMTSLGKQGLWPTCPCRTESQSGVLRRRSPTGDKGTSAMGVHVGWVAGLEAGMGFGRAAEAKCAQPST